MSADDATRFDADRIYATFLERGNAWADAEAAASLYEETRKSVLAEIKLASTEKSDAARETEALATGKYRTHLEQMVEARHAANRARVAYEAVKTLAELRRSEETTRRTEAMLAKQGALG